MRTLSVLTALFFLAGCNAFQLTATPQPGPPEPTRVAPPAAGKRVEVDVKPGQTVCLDVPSLKDARMVVRSGGLLVVMPNGGEIFLRNFRPSEDGLPAALCLADQTLALVLEADLGEIAPGGPPGAPDDGLDSEDGEDGDDGGGGGNGGGENGGGNDGNRSGQADDSNPGGVDNEDQGGTDNPGGGGGQRD